MTTPIWLDYSRNPYVIVVPHPGIGWGFSFKKEWPAQRQNKWYSEIGLTTQGIRYYHLDIGADSLRAWSDGVEYHTGFPAVLFGMGKTFGFRDNRSAVSVGLEGSLNLEQTLQEIIAYSFGIGQYQLKDFKKPLLFLRLNLGYNYNFRIAKNWPGQLRFYTSLSAQDITKGDQYLRDKVDGTIQRGRYGVNNSELGMQLFVGLKKAEPLKSRPANATQNALLAMKEKKVKYRISIGGQIFEHKEPQYIVPQVDSFSVKGRETLLTGQLVVEAEFPFRRNNRWGVITGIGYGSILGTLIFKSDNNFPANKVPISKEYNFLFGSYGSVQLGLSRRGAIGKFEFAHRLSVTGMQLFPNEYVYLGIPLETNSAPFPPYENAVLEGSVTYNGSFLVGGEYNPEIYFKLKKQYFIALGLLFNYTYDVAAYGTFVVSNPQTTYYGGLVQEFSKIGISARIGLER